MLPFSIFGSANSVSGAFYHFWRYQFCRVCSILYLRIGAHPGGRRNLTLLLRRPLHPP
nr:MAG TPA: hypothetical protein [Bacteriophage sp.]